MQEENEAKVTAVFTRLTVNGKTYYKCMKVVPEFIPDEDCDSLANRIDSKKNEFYVTADKKKLTKIGVREDAIFYEEDGLQLLNNDTELSYIKMKFENVIKAKEDATIMFNSHELLVNKYVDKVYGDAQCHKSAIKEIVQTIVLNKDINDSNMTDRDKYLAHDNIVLFGPVGSGKTLILDALKRNLQVPTVTVDLDTDVDINRGLIAEAIMNSKKEFNGHAVVIAEVDFDKIGEEGKKNPFYPLKEISNSTNLYYSPYLDKPIDFRELTFITSVNAAGENLKAGTMNDMENFFMHMTGCTKAIGVKRLTMTQTRKVIYDSVFSKLKFCEEIAHKYNRTLTIDKKALGAVIKYNEIFNGNVLTLETAIVESFKMQLALGYKEITIGEELFVIIKGLLETEKKAGWLEEPDSEEEEKETKENEKDEEKVPLKEIPVNAALADREKAIDDLTEQIKTVIKGQDGQVRDVVTAIIDNQEIAYDQNEENPESNKLNILIRGSSGTGKTEIVRLISKTMGIPMVVEDATRYTEEGYVGESVTDMLLDLYRETGEDINKAERGIIVIDEIDKKAHDDGRNSDVSRAAVLNSLLKMIEGEIYRLDYKKATPQGMMTQNIKFDTRRLTFVILGAFQGLEDYREDRIKKASKPKGMGFMTESQQQVAEKELEGINRDFINEDYISFGFTDQFINRFDEKIYLNSITRDTMLEIMKFGAKSPLLLLQKRYAKYGVELVFTDDFCERLADIAMTKNSGARSIKEVFGDLKKFVNFNGIRKSQCSRITFTKECFDDPNALILEEKGKVYKK